MPNKKTKNEKKDEKNKVIIFDTTLRDGEQCPGASLTIEEKLRVAKQLSKMGVDVIEAGFPIASPGDFEAVKRVAKEVKGPIIAGLARSMPADIDRAYEAVKYSDKPRIHVFIATSKIHMQYKLKKAEDEIVRIAVDSVKRAKSYVSDVEFSPEDASRTDPEFLVRVIKEVIDAGATTVNIPDTVGYSEPEEFGKLIQYITKNTPNIDKAIISVHCHNDLGNAVANSLAAIKNGARQVECTVNGIGERAGNCSLEEVVMNLKVRKDIYNVDSGIITEEITKSSRLVSKLTGFLVQKNKAIVGENAFAHEAGIHQHGMLCNTKTYEIMNPKDVGLSKSELVLGKHSGRHAFVDRINELGYDVPEKEVDQLFDSFKVLADKKKTVYNEDIEALILQGSSSIPEMYVLKSFNVTSGNSTIPTATVEIEKNGEVLRDASIGDGPVDSVYKAIERISGISVKLKDYQIKAVTSGKEALGEASIVAEIDGKNYHGRGASTDIIEASAQAYLQCINKSVYKANVGNGKKEVKGD